MPVAVTGALTGVLASPPVPWTSTTETVPPVADVVPLTMTFWPVPYGDWNTPMVAPAVTLAELMPAPPRR